LVALACALPSVSWQTRARNKRASTACGLARRRRKPLPLGFVELLAKLRRQYAALSFPMASAFPNARRA
jgi:hypothetical protein